MYGTAVVGVSQGSGSTGQGSGSANSGLDNPPLQHPWASMAAINYEMKVFKRRGSTMAMGQAIKEAKAKLAHTETRNR